MKELKVEQESSVYRVWIPDEYCPNLTWLGAFGGFCLKDYGLIAIPKVYFKKLPESDEFVFDK